MYRNSSSYRTSRAALAAGAAFGISLLLALFLVSGALASTPAWEPDASERLVKLPASYLKKAVDRDFADSELAIALGQVNAQIKPKMQTLKDLQAAIDKADGEVRTELRHQFLAEKQAFIKLIGEQQEMRKSHLETQMTLYERVLDKMARRQGAMTPARAKLIQDQQAARERFENSIAAVDVKMFGSAAVEESKYARDYAKNMGAIEQLVQAIQAHPMNQGPEMDGEELTKEEYLRRLISDTQAEIAILDQEGTILGYMAKLVALDAMTLSEDVAAANDGEDVIGADGGVDVTSTVDFFITQ